MIVYWPIGVLAESDPFWGDTQHTYDSCTSWEEVEDCFRCWIFDYGMRFKKLLVDVCDLDKGYNNPEYRHTYELHLKLQLGDEVDREEWVKPYE